MFSLKTGLLIFLLSFMGVVVEAEDYLTIKLNDNQNAYEILHWGDEQEKLSLIQGMEQDKEGMLWLASQNGLFKFDGHEFKQFNTGNTELLQGNFFEGIYYDSEQRLWASNVLGFGYFKNDQYFPVEWRERLSVKHFAEYNGSLFLATDEGLYCWSYKDKVVKDIPKIKAKNMHKSIIFEDSIYFTAKDYIARYDGESIFILDIPENLEINDLAVFNQRLMVASNRGLFEIKDLKVVSVLDAFSENLTSISVGPQKLWLGSSNGVWLVEKNDQIVQLDDRGLLGNRWVTNIFHDKDGMVWIGTKDSKLHRLREMPFSFYSKYDGLPSNGVWSAIQAKRGGAWIGTELGIALLHNHHVSLPIDNTLLPSKAIVGLLEDSHENLWVGTQSGLVVFDKNGDVSDIDLQQLPKRRVSAILENDNGDIYIGYSPGVIIYKPELGIFESVAELKQQKVRDLFKSSRNNILVATESNVFSLKEHTVNYLGNSKESLAGFALSVNESSDGSVWISYVDQGLVRWKNQTVTNFTTANGLSANTVLETFFDHRDQLWVSTLTSLEVAPLPKIEPESEAFASNIKFRKVLSNSLLDFEAIYADCCHGGTNSSGFFDKENNLFVSGVNGLFKLDLKQTGKQEPLPQPIILSAQVTRPNNAKPLVLSRFVLPIGVRDFEVNYSAINFTKPKGIQFKYRLLGYQDDWQKVGVRRQAIYTNIQPGEYTFEVLTTSQLNDNQSRVVSVPIVIKANFFETGWFLIGLVCLGVLLMIITVKIWNWQHFRFSRTLEIERESESSLDILQSKNIHRFIKEDFIDELTQVYNKKFLDSYMAELLDFKGEEHASKVNHMSIILIDVGCFRKINQDNGSSIGDRALINAAQFLVSLSREEDFLVRYHGDVFVILSQNKNYQNAKKMVARLSKALQAFKVTMNEDIQVSFESSIGFIYCDSARPGRLIFDEEQLFEMAFFLLDLVKRKGRNGWAGCLLRLTLRSEDILAKEGISSLLKNRYFELCGSNKAKDNSEVEEVC